MIKFYIVAQLLVSQLADRATQPKRDERGASVLEMVLIAAFVIGLGVVVFAAIKAVVDREVGKIN